MSHDGLAPDLTPDLIPDLTADLTPDRAPDLSAAFTAYFTAVHGHAPFPWQARLAARVALEGWPSLLDLPTGTGKTSALDIALFALAYAPEKASRRVFLVVDRRIVVDQGALHAKKILEKLRDGAAPDVTKRLRALFGGDSNDDPFAIAVLRGGMPREDEWARRPDQPVLGVSTVDQVGSRLLFRGYGVSDRMASVHAGLLGNDTLILLDEVHLAEPFAQTLGHIAQRWQKNKATSPLPSRFGFVRMSATPGVDVADAFGLDDADRQHDVLRQRLGASKRARLQEVKVTGDEEAKRKKLASECVEQARALLKAGARVIGVVVNRVDTAREAWRLFQSDKKADADAVLLTGRMRPLDRDLVLAGEPGVLARAGAGRARKDDDKPLVLFATQCVEAGADLDLDGLVTECASLDALRQRFGRLNRRGELGTSQAVVLMRSDQVKPKQPDPVYGEALPKTWEWLTSQGDEVDFGIDEVGPRLPTGDALLSMLAPKEQAPILLPAHLDAWVQTSPRPAPDPEVALWLHGPERSAPEVQLVWRADLDESDLDERNAERLLALLSACRPSSLEALSLPIHAVRAWLRGASEQPEIDDVSNAAGAATSREREAPKERQALRWRGDVVEVVSASALQPGDTLLVPASYGGLSAANWDPRAKEPVLDLGDVAQVRAGRRPTLRAHPDVLAAWGFDEATRKSAPLAPLPDDADRKAVLADWVAALPTSASAWSDEWMLLRSMLQKAPRAVELPNGRYALYPSRNAGVEVTTEDDDSSFVEQAVTLRGHSRDVETWAERFATCVGLSESVARDVKLAGWLHDVGKADPRFQRWLVGGSELKRALLDEPLAKSQGSPKDRAARELARRRAAYPVGYRHELLSVAMIERSEEVLREATDRDLVLHLVASHHGWCRPFAPALDHPDALDVEVAHGETQLAGNTRHGLARLDSGVSDRFWALVEKYGWWGLAWLEAIVRLADHRASEHPSEREAT